MEGDVVDLRCCREEGGVVELGSKSERDLFNTLLVVVVLIVMMKPSIIWNTS